jgi:DNA repair protein RadB
VTQFYGPPASGKTNVALRAAVETAASGARTAFVDTEGVSPDRFEQLLSGRVDDVDAASGRVVISAARDFDEQSEAVQDVTDLAPGVDLVVLDSATGFYRLRRTADGDDDGEALRAVARQVTHLLSLARRHDLAVLLTNQVYTDPDADRSRPLGGHTLAHWTSTIVRLERFRGGRRRATLEKHRSAATGDSVTFQITDSGLTAADGR